MSAPAETGWDMYDPRMTVKAEAAEIITKGYACYIASDGKAYLCDNSVNNMFHGCALQTVAAGEKVTLVTHGRLYTTVAQTIGNKAKSTTSSGGAVPSTTLSGIVCGTAIAAYLIQIHAEPASNNA